jgi:two-component system cell cycle sensor histidine kinase/response regulator CckA
MSSPLRILVVDDNPGNAASMSALIASAEGMSDARIERETSYDTALGALQRSAYDVAIADDLLDGLALLRRARDSGVATPVVIVAASAGKEVAAAAIKGGAADCLSRGHLTAASVASALRHAAGRLEIGPDPHAGSADSRPAPAIAGGGADQFRAIVEHSADVLMLIGANGRFTYVSPSAARQFGWNTGDRIGRLVVDVVHPDDVATMTSRFGQALRTHEPVSTELRLLHGDGTYRTVEAVAVNRLHEPALRAFVVSARDVTAARLVDEQVRQVQKMEAVGRLAGGIAHDFNNLLTAILGYCNLLLEDVPADTPLRSDLEEIRNAGDRAAALTRQLLAFSRRQMLQPQPIRLSALVAQMEPLLRQRLGDNLELVTALAADLPIINVDPVSIEEIVNNLAMNARDAMPDGGRLTIETASVELHGAYLGKHPMVMPGPYVMLAVSDTGEGMEASTSARVFEPFFTTKGQGKGTGLGLATVYGLVKQSGGYIWVYSEPGHGTVFKVYLPPAEISPARQRDLEQGVPAGSETVLMVEDEDAVRAFGSEVLRRHGYAVLEARNALEALRLVERHQGIIHLMVTDVVMPYMTGPELAERIRQARASLKVLFMSGYTEHAIVHREVSAGVPFLQKPFTPIALARKVRALLDDAAPAR